jgi:hypothetical protein
MGRRLPHFHTELGISNTVIFFKILKKKKTVKFPRLTPVILAIRDAEI